MKCAIIFLLVSVCFCNCGEKKETIDFVTLKETEFNAKPFALPFGNIRDSLKQVHDSCMGFSFNANAFLAPTRDTFFIGNVVNRQSLKVVNTLRDLGLTRNQLFSNFNMLTNPCYAKRVLHLPLKLMLGENFIRQFPTAGEAVNKEIGEAIAASGEAEMTTGSWVYLDVKYALKSIMDTIKSAGGLRYKENLLDTANMVLTSTESITNVSFLIDAEKDFSEPTQVLLKSKPSVSYPNSQLSIQLFYISSNRFQITFNGFFPVVGEFMKAELK